MEPCVKNVSASSGTESSAVRWIRFGVFLAAVTLPLAGQTFPISVDASALSAPDVNLSTYGTIPPATVVTTSLAAGTYTLSHISFPGRAQVTFSVTAGGTVSYDAALEGILTGAGSASLVAHGATIAIDGSALSVYDATLYYTGISLHAPVTLHLLPGGYTIQHVSFPSYASIGFSITASGTVSYDPISEGMLTGAGTTALVAHGATIAIDASALSVYDANLYYTGISLHSAATLHLLPGGYTIQHVSFPSYASIGFSVTPSGTVSYDPISEGMLTGAGTTALTAIGAQIALDASLLSPVDVNLAYTGISLEAPATLNLLPGPYTIGYVSSPTNIGVGFTIGATGTLNYDPALEGVMTGSGSTVLGVPGAAIKIAMGSLGSVVQLNYVGLYPACSTLHLLPGVHSIPAGAFSVLAAGMIDFSPILDPVMSGRGTSTLSLIQPSGHPADCSNPPTAVAGPDQQLHAGTVVHLDGRASFDDDTATVNLGFSWTFVARPVGSTAVIVDPTSPTPTFTADLSGEYIVSLVVTDTGAWTSAPDTVSISSENSPPTAIAGPDLPSAPSFTVVLDGSASTDPDMDPLTYSWTLLERPVGSTANIQTSGPSVPTATLVTDLPGVYRVGLIANDGFSNSVMDEVIITAAAPTDFAQIMLAAAQAAVNNLQNSEVDKRGNRDRLARMIADAIVDIQSLKLAQAKRTIDDALLRVDGCALRGTPDTAAGPDRDWVVTCGAQATIYPKLLAARQALGP